MQLIIAMARLLCAQTTSNPMEQLAVSVSALAAIASHLVRRVPAEHAAIQRLAISNLRRTHAVQQLARAMRANIARALLLLALRTRSSPLAQLAALLVNASRLVLAMALRILALVALH